MSLGFYQLILFYILFLKIKDNAVSLGDCPGPQECYLSLRGLRTLSTRLEHHRSSALKIARLLDNKTAYQTDTGMTGDYNSVIGMDRENPIHAFTLGYRREGRFTPANGKGKICGVFIESNDKNTSPDTKGSKSEEG